MKKIPVISLFIMCLIFGGIYISNNSSQKVSHKKNTHEYKPQRGIAASAGQQQVIDDIVERIIAVRYADEINPLIDNLTENYMKMAIDNNYHIVKVYLNALNTMKKLESFIWRLRYLAEYSDLVHVNALVSLRTVYQQDYMYGSHIKAGFEYLTRPSETLTMFKSIDELQETVYQFSKVLGQMDKKLEEIYQNVPAKELEFSFDRRIITGGGDGTDPSQITYLDKEEMRKTFIKPYIKSMQMILKRYEAWANVASIVDLSGVPKVLSSLTKKTAINMAKAKLSIKVFGKKKKVAKGLSSKIIFNTIKETSGVGTTKVSPAVAQQRLNHAKELFKKASADDLAAYVCGIMYPIMLRDDSDYNSTDCVNFDSSVVNDDTHLNESFAKSFMLNANFMLVNRKNKYHDIRQLYDLYHADGNFSMISKVTGQEVIINIDEIFKYQADYRKFLPTSYNNDGRGRVNEDGKWEWNYEWGRPLTWQNGVWSKMFPQITGNGSGSGESSINRLLTNLEYTEALIPFATLISAP